MYYVRSRAFSILGSETEDLFPSAETALGLWQLKSRAEKIKRVSRWRRDMVLAGSFPGNGN
jgi:hypothetical protein